MRLQRLAFVLLALTAAACGGGDESEPDDGDTGDTGSVNTTVAQTTVRSTIAAANQAVNASDGQASAFSMAAMGAAAFSIVAPASSAGAQSISDGLGHAMQGEGEGTCDCPSGGTSCTFTDCGDAAGAWTVSGTMSWGGGNLKGDLTFLGAYTAYTWEFSEAFELEVTKTSIEGSFSSEGSYSVDAMGQSVGGEWTSSFEYEAIGFDTAGCPTKGKLHVEADVTSNGFSYGAEGDVEFDASACGG